MGTNFDFGAMVFETSGAVNVEGLNIIKQLIRFASKREGVQNSVFAVVHGLVACSIQYSVAQGILNRAYFEDEDNNKVDATCPRCITIGRLRLFFLGTK